MAQPTGKTNTTAKKKERFLKAFENCGIVLVGAKAAGVCRQTIYHWRDIDPKFARAFDEASENAADHLEAVAMERARAASDVLLIFLLKGMRPEKYRERVDASLAHSGELKIIIEQVNDWRGGSDG